MKYVLDASVGLKFVLAEGDSDKTIRVRDDAQSGIHALIAPDVFLVETAHTLTKKERQGLVTDAEKLWDGLMLDRPPIYPSAPLMKRAIRIARQARIAVYDCLYVALAEREGCELLTADDRLKRNLPGSPVVLPSSLP